MTADLRIDHYDWAGGREAMLRFGPADGLQVVVAPPLFEEANRTRALIAATLRILARHGIGGALPDLPSQGESPCPTVDARLPSWRAAFAAAVAAIGARCHVVAIRGGALVDGEAMAMGRLHLSPEPGATLVRDLLRARRIAAVAAGGRPPADDPGEPGPPLLLAGNLIDRDLLQALMAATPGPADRTIRLFPDNATADRLLAPAGQPDAAGDRSRFRTPWTASEPFMDPALAAMLAEEIAGWMRSCAG